MKILQKRQNKKKVSVGMSSEEMVLQQKKKQGHRKKLVVPVVVLVVVLLAVGITQASAMVNGAAKLFMDPAEYYQYIEEKNAKRTATVLSSLYSSMMWERMNVSDQYTNYELTLGLGDKAIDLLSASGNEEYAFLNQLTLNFGINSKNNIVQTTLGMEKKGEEFLSGNLILDWNDERIYAQVPQLKQEYLFMEFDLLFELLGVDADSLKAFMDANMEVYDKMPEAAEIESAINRYVAAALPCIEEVEEETCVLEANDVFMDCTKLTVTIDEKTVQNMVERVLKAMEKGTEWEQQLFKVLATQEEIQLEEALELIIWVDRYGNVCGRSISYEDDHYRVMEASYIITRDKNVFGLATMINMDGVKIRLDGNAAFAKQRLEGEAEVKVAGFEIGKVEFSDVQIGKETFRGTILVRPDETMMKLVQGEINEGSLLDFSDIGLEFAIDNIKEKNMLEVSLLLGKDMVLSVKTASEHSAGKDTFLPEEEKCEDVLTYCADLSLENLLKGLETAGFPDSVTEWLENIK